jgi:hypothetical protein
LILAQIKSGSLVTTCSSREVCDESLVNPDIVGGFRVKPACWLHTLVGTGNGSSRVFLVRESMMIVWLFRVCPRFLVVLVLLALPGTAMAEQSELRPWGTILAAVSGEPTTEGNHAIPAGKSPGYMGGFGISFRQVQLDIMEGSENLIVASIRGNFIPTPYFNVMSPIRRLGDSQFGYYWKYAFSMFTMDEQESFFAWESQWQDMGTSVRGQFFYAMPVLVWQPEENMRWGLGFGLGYISMNGEVIIFRDFDPNQPFTHDISVNELTTGYYLSWEFGKGGLIFGVGIGGLTGRTKPYKYDLMDLSLDVGIRKEF